MQNFVNINSDVHLKPRLAKKEDEQLLLNWANDPIVRSNGFKTEMIPLEVHRNWFYSRLQDKENCKFYVVENEKGLPIGQVRLDKKLNKWYINFSLANFARGKKLGTVLLETVIEQLKNQEKQESLEFIAEVKQGNIASCRVFEKIGFVRTYSDNKKIIFFYNMKKNFMVVGGGFGQIPAILAAKSLGLNVIVIDRDSNGDGMKLADKALPIDVLDIKSIVKAAQKYSIVGALTMQSDIGIPAVGAVVDELRLKGSGREVAERCSNKILMRKAFERHQIPQPKFKVIDSIDEALISAKEIGFPCVIKAPDSSASRGIVRVNNQNEVSYAFDEASRYSRLNQLLVEEYIEGLEFGAQAFSVDGKCSLVLVHDDEMSEPPYMIPLAHSFPSTLPKEALLGAEEAIKACVSALGIKDGPSNIDLIFDKDGNPRIIEVGARIGATCLPELVLYYKGIDFTRAAVQIACGMKPDLSTKFSQPCAAFILESRQDGVMKSYKISDDLRNNPNILEWEITSKPGQTVSRLRKGTDRIGKIVVKGNTSREALNLARDFSLAFKLDVYKNELLNKNV
jgi:biotin carboxylase/RimJ/RimL family protein N-acetyltransferase